MTWGSDISTQINKKVGKPYNATDARHYCWLCPFWRRGCSYGVGRWYCFAGRRYVPIGCQYKPTLYLALFGHDLWCRFLTTELWAPSLGEGMVVGGWIWVHWVAQWWLRIGCPCSNHSLVKPTRIGYMGDSLTGQKTQRTVSKYWRKLIRQRSLSTFTFIEAAKSFLWVFNVEFFLQWSGHDSDCRLLVRFILRVVTFTTQSQLSTDQSTCQPQSTACPTDPRVNPVMTTVGTGVQLWSILCQTRLSRHL